MIRILLPLLVLLSCTACDSRTGTIPPPNATLVLRTYDVPKVSPDGRLIVMRRSALNLAANRLRGRKLRRFFSLESAEHAADPKLDPHASLEVQQRRAAVRQAIEALPEKLKSVVVLCELSGLSTQQIADTLEIPAGTVSSRRSLAMDALEKSLGALQLEVTS